MTPNGKQQQTGPRLVKAADLAAQKARDAEEALARTKRKSNVDALAREAVIRLRAPRDARDARLAFDALFGKPAA